MTAPGVIFAEGDRECELCGAVEECRPYGPGYKQVCFKCMMLDEEGAKRRFAAMMLGVKNETD